MVGTASGASSWERPPTALLPLLPAAASPTAQRSPAPDSGPVAGPGPCSLNPRRGADEGAREASVGGAGRGQHLFQVPYFRTNKTKPKELKAGLSPGGPHAPCPASHARTGHTLLPRPCCSVQAAGGEAQGQVLTSKHSFWKLLYAILRFLEKDLGEKGVCPTK